jgi:hypothetical protein
MWHQRCLNEEERRIVAKILDAAGASSLLRTVAGMIELRHPVQGCSARYSRRLFRVAQDLDADRDAMEDAGRVAEGGRLTGGLAPPSRPGKGLRSVASGPGS